MHREAELLHLKGIRTAADRSICEGEEALIVLDTTENDYFPLVLLVGCRRRDWPLVVSANCLDHIWSFVTWGWTPFSVRKDLRGRSPILDVLAQVYGQVRSERGRVFINHEGAFYKIFPGQYIQFAKFSFVCESQQSAA